MRFINFSLKFCELFLYTVSNSIVMYIFSHKIISSCSVFYQFITSIFHFKIVFKKNKILFFFINVATHDLFGSNLPEIVFYKCAFLTFLGAFLYPVCLLQETYGKIVKKKSKFFVFILMIMNTLH